MQRVLSYVGPGHYILLAAVSKAWKLCYAQVAPAEMKKVLFDTSDFCSSTSFKPVHCTAKMTLYSTVFASAACMQLVVDYKLQMGRSDLYSKWAEPVDRSMGYFADIQTLQLAQKLGCQFSSETMIGAAMTGSVAKLQWLLEAQRQQLSEPVFHVAAKRSHLRLMRWLAKRRCPFDPDMLCGHAVEGGASIELLQWLRELGAKYTVDTMAQAAGKGRLDLVKFLHSEQCPWDQDASDWAAAGGHADVLQWLFEQGAPWYDNIWSVPAREGHISVLSLLLTIPEIADDPDVKTAMLQSAGAHSKLAAAQWLRKQGAQWPARLISWGTPWQGEALAWARAEGCTAPTLYPEDDDV